MTRVLVTGAHGFLGRHLVQRLVDDGHEVHGLAGRTSPPAGRTVDLQRRLTLHPGSLTRPDTMRDLVRRARPEVVVHLAGFTSVARSWDCLDECLQANVQGTLTLLQALDEAGWPARRFVHVSSSEVYGTAPVPFVEDGPVEPVSPYAVSKQAAERYCRVLHDTRGWPLVVLRPFNAYGPGQQPDRVVPTLIAKAERRDPLPMTQGRQTREFLYVDDVVDGLVAAALQADDRVLGRTVNLCSGQEVSLRELTWTLLRVLDSPVVPEFGALPERTAEIPRSTGDPALAASLLGWRARVPLEEGLRRTVRAAREEALRAAPAWSGASA